MKQSMILALGFLCFFLVSCNNLFHKVATPPLTYTVTFDENGGDTPADPRTMTVTPPEITLDTLPTPPSRAGYSFSGWADEYGLVFTTDTPVIENITVYARWNLGSGHTVTFFTNGGSEVSSQSITHDGTASRPANPSRNGYTFDNWYSNPELTARYDFSTPVTSGVFIYANWKNGTYQVNYDANGGNGNMANSTHEFDVESALGSNAFTRTGYTFASWNTQDNGSGARYADGQMVKNLGSTAGATVTLYAQWFCNIPGTHTVRFYSNGGTLINPQAVMKGETATRPWNPSRNGYEFDAWYSNQVLPEVYSFDAKVNDDISLYAKWKSASSYTVTYEKNAAGATGSTADRSHTYDDESPLRANGFALAGYAFASWSTGPGGSGIHYGDGQSVKNLGAAGEPAHMRDITLYANWKAASYTVTYAKNDSGAIGVMADSVHTFDADRILNPNSFIFEGHTFSSWNTQANGSGTRYADMESVKNLGSKEGDKISLYAQWTENTPDTHVVRFYGNGGSFVNSQFLRTGNKVAEPAIPVRAGYTFGRWYKESGLKTPWNFASDTISGDTGLYANWNPVTYTVQYNGNNATGGSTSPSSHRYDTENRLSVNGFARTGYAFVSWNTQSDGQGTHYYGGQNVKNLSTTAADVTLYAKWEPATYTVRFHSDRGDVVADQFKGHGGKVDDPSASDLGFRTGYTLDGWYKEAGLTTEWDFVSDTVSGDTNLYAKWVAITYEVEYDANGGSGTMANSTHEFDVEKNLTANAFTRTDYGFGSWNTQSDGQGTSYTNEWSAKNLSVTDGATVTLYAQWVRVYTVSFDKNDGTGVYHTEEINEGSSTQLQDEPSRDGYRFTGWTLNADGSGDVYAAGASYPPTDNVTFYAQWVQTYTVSFNNNGGNGEISSITVVAGEPITLPSGSGFSKTDYKFVGWSTTSGTSNSAGKLADSSYTPPNTITLYAIWVRVYLVTFNAAGGSPTPDPQTVVEGDKVETVTKPSREHYDFKGWYNGATPWDFDNDTVSSAMTLTAQWMAKQYTITFSGNSQSSGTTPGPITQAYDTYITSMPGNTGNLQRNSYVFGGWNTQADGNGDNYLEGANNYPITGNATLYAKWNAVYTVSFNLNNGSGTTPDSQSEVDGTIIQLPLQDDIERDGYEFGGWNTLPSGQGNNYDAGANYTITSNATLHAKWNQIYTVSFNLNGSTSGTTPEPLTGTAGTQKTLPAQNDILRTNYTFDGWNTLPNGLGTNYNAGMTNYVITSDVSTLYARWYSTVTYDTDGGGTVSPGSVNVYAGASTQLPDGTGLSKTGYKFYGWQDNTNTKVTSPYMPNGHTTLKAIWLQAYTLTFYANTGTGAVPGPWTVIAGDSEELPAQGTLSKTGYTFSGWNSQADGNGTPYAVKQIIQPTGDMDFYAQWSVNTYRVTFNSAGGTLTPASQDVDYGKYVDDPGDPGRTNYTFDGWYTDSDVKWNFASSTMPASDMTLTAKWDEITTYTVTFLGTWDSGAIAVQNVEYNKTATRPSPDPTRNGFTFIGWYNIPANLTADQLFEYLDNPYNFGAAVTENLTLYAIWTSATITGSSSSINFRQLGGGGLTY